MFVCFVNEEEKLLFFHRIKHRHCQSLSGAGGRRVWDLDIRLEDHLESSEPSMGISQLKPGKREWGVWGRLHPAGAFPCLFWILFSIRLQASSSLQNCSHSRSPQTANHYHCHRSQNSGSSSSETCGSSGGSSSRSGATAAPRAKGITEWVSSVAAWFKKYVHLDKTMRTRPLILIKINNIIYLTIIY